MEEPLISFNMSSSVTKTNSFNRDRQVGLARLWEWPSPPFVNTSYSRITKKKKQQPQQQQQQQQQQKTSSKFSMAQN